jgi:hypothetical protein
VGQKHAARYKGQHDSTFLYVSTIIQLNPTSTLFLFFWDEGKFYNHQPKKLHTPAAKQEHKAKTLPISPQKPDSTTATSQILNTKYCEIYPN